MPPSQSFSTRPGPTLALVDRHPVYLAGLSSVLQRQGGFAIVGIGSAADEAVALAQQLKPGVMLIDLSIPGGGLKALRDITSFSDTRTIALTDHDQPNLVLGALEAGAHGVVSKGSEAAELVSAIISVHQGVAFVTPRLLAQIMRRQLRRSAVHTFDDLTRREETIIGLVAKGLTNREIAAELGLAQVTVRNHVGSVMSKLNARNRLHACILAADLLPGVM